VPFIQFVINVHLGLIDLNDFMNGELKVMMNFLALNVLSFLKEI